MNITDYRKVFFIVLCLLFTAAVSNASHYIKVFFNNPESSSSPALSEYSSENTAIDDALVAFINSASSGDTLYAAFYDLDRDKIAAAFNSATARGVTLYFISDNVEGNTAEYASLTTSSKTLDSSSKLMHNKFCVLKDSAVWTGSYNVTDNGTESNCNNAVLIYSPSLAQIYATEFLEMYGGNFQTSKTQVSNTARTVTLDDGTRLDVYFAPYTSAATTASEAVQNCIDNAGYSVLFNIFKFTASETGIVSSLKSAYDKGLETKGVFDTGSIYDFGSHTSAYASLKEYGFDVVTSGVESKLHHKFCVIDYGSSKAKVITGSYNWTSTSQNSNDENFVIIYSTEVAERYWNEFQKNYKVSDSILDNDRRKAVRNVLIYPSPAEKTSTVNIGYELSSSVIGVKILLYSVSGYAVKTLRPQFYTGTYNEETVVLTNDSGEKLASGLYIVKVEAETADGTFYNTEKFALVR